MRNRPRLAAGVLLAALAGAAHAAAPTPERVQELCADADGPVHCARRIEADQLKGLPNLAVRDGDTLRVTMYPAGSREFTDTLVGLVERSYALWDYWSPINAVVLFVTQGTETGFAVLQRASGQLTALPAEPVLAPDRQRVAVADFCAQGCTDELSLWRVARDGLRREATLKPAAAWSDVTVAWKNPDVLTIRYTPRGGADAKTEERALTDRAWRRD